MLPFSRRSDAEKVTYLGVSPKLRYFGANEKRRDATEGKRLISYRTAKRGARANGKRGGCLSASLDRLARFPLFVYEAGALFTG